MGRVSPQLDATRTKKTRGFCATISTRREINITKTTVELALTGKSGARTYQNSSAVAKKRPEREGTTSLESNTTVCDHLARPTGMNSGGRVTLGIGSPWGRVILGIGSPWRYGDSVTLGP